MHISHSSDRFNTRLYCNELDAQNITAKTNVLLWTLFILNTPHQSKHLHQSFTLINKQSSHPKTSPTYSAGSPISLSRFLAPRFPPSLTRGLCIALVPISRGPVWVFSQRTSFAGAKGWCTYAFSPRLTLSSCRSSSLV